jgi:hypothetical protein
MRGQRTICFVDLGDKRENKFTNRLKPRLLIFAVKERGLVTSNIAQVRLLPEANAQSPQ